MVIPWLGFSLGELIKQVEPQGGAKYVAFETANDPKGRGIPQTDALTIEQFKDKQAEAVNQLLGLVFALLALSVIVALLGSVGMLTLGLEGKTLAWRPAKAATPGGGIQ